MDDPKTTQPECEEPWVGDLNDLVQFADRGIVSKTLVDCTKSKIVWFGMKTGQSISGHAVGTPATIQVLSGAGRTVARMKRVRIMFVLPHGLSDPERSR